MADKWYAWSELRNGGTSTERKNANGSTIRVIESRNIIQPGEVVTQKGLGVDDAGWDALVAGGSVRNYPLPAGTEEGLSPHDAVMKNLVDENGNIDVNKFLSAQTELGALATLPAPTNPSAEEGKTLETPKGA